MTRTSRLKFATRMGKMPACLLLPGVTAHMPAYDPFPPTSIPRYRYHLTSPIREIRCACQLSVFVRVTCSITVKNTCFVNICDARCSCSLLLIHSLLSSSLTISSHHEERNTARVKAATKNSDIIIVHIALKNDDDPTHSTD